MAETGILSETDRVELIEGQIIQMSPVGVRHAACVKRTHTLLSQLVGKRAIIGVQDPVRLNHYSEPEPDVAVLHYRPDFYATDHPAAEDIYLLIEVAETTLAYDRTIKLPMYAKAGVLEVWIINLNDNSVEVHRQPTADRYAFTQRLTSTDTLTVSALPDVEFPVSALVS